MRTIPELSNVLTQSDFGALVGVSQGAVSQMVSAGFLPQPLELGPALLAYCARLREQAAGRYTEGELDLAQERALLARSQRTGIDRKNAEAAGLLAPRQLLEEVLANAAAAFVERMDHVPGTLRRNHPDLSVDAIEAVVQTLARARNEFVDQARELVTARIIGTDDDDDTDTDSPTPNED